MKLKEITNELERFAPLAYQESYDNSGLIVGDPEMEVKAALICLDSTEQVLDEALSLGANLVIAHHPIVFSGLKKLTGGTYVERVLLKAIRNNIAIYAAHTNLDNVEDGVNRMIAQKIGLRNCSILAPQKGLLKKLITFCPAEKAEEVRNALFSAGAGQIGNYSECSFNSSGEGTFKAGESADPYVGKIGERATEKEVRIETVYPAWVENRVVNALIKSHPYEEVAYDLIALSNVYSQVGSGLVGELDETGEEEFLKKLKKSMRTELVRHTALLGKKVKKVAVCGGAGSFLLPHAIRAGADVFVTGDFKYHQFFDADNQIVVADVGHYESEQFTVELFYEILNQKFSTFALHLTKINTNPIKYL